MKSTLPLLAAGLAMSTITSAAPIPVVANTQIHLVKRSYSDPDSDASVLDRRSEEAAPSNTYIPPPRSDVSEGDVDHVSLDKRGFQSSGVSGIADVIVADVIAPTANKFTKLGSKVVTESLPAVSDSVVKGQGWRKLQAAIPYLEDTKYVSKFKKQIGPMSKSAVADIEAAVAKRKARELAKQPKLPLPKPVDKSKVPLTSNQKLALVAAGTLGGFLAWKMAQQRATTNRLEQLQYDQMQAKSAQVAAKNAELSEYNKKVSEADDAYDEANKENTATTDAGAARRSVDDDLLRSESLADTEVDKLGIPQTVYVVKPRE